MVEELEDVLAPPVKLRETALCCAGLYARRRAGWRDATEDAVLTKRTQREKRREINQVPQVP